MFSIFTVVKVQVSQAEISVVQTWCRLIFSSFFLPSFLYFPPFFPSHTLFYNIFPLCHVRFFSLNFHTAQLFKINDFKITRLNREHTDMHIQNFFD